MEERFDYDGLLEVNANLREQNRVLVSALDAIRKKSYEPDPERPALSTRAEIQLMAEAALTATSRPQPPYKEWCRHPEKCCVSNLLSRERLENERLTR